MKAVERRAMWHHTVFSLLLAVAMAVLFFVRHDVPSLLIIASVVLYVAGNTLLHIRHHNFRKETFYEYLLLGAAVMVVLLGAVRH